MSVAIFNAKTKKIKKRGHTTTVLDKTVVVCPWSFIFFGQKFAAVLTAAIFNAKTKKIKKRGHRKNKKK